MRHLAACARAHEFTVFVRLAAICGQNSSPCFLDRKLVHSVYARAISVHTYELCACLRTALCIADRGDVVAKQCGRCLWRREYSRHAREREPDHRRVIYIIRLGACTLQSENKISHPRAAVRAMASLETTVGSAILRFRSTGIS